MEIALEFRFDQEADRSRQSRTTFCRVGFRVRGVFQNERASESTICSWFSVVLTYTGCWRTQRWHERSDTSFCNREIPREKQKTSSMGSRTASVALSRHAKTRPTPASATHESQLPFLDHPSPSNFTYPTISRLDGNINSISNFY